MAYCAYVCESGLGTWRVAAAASDVRIDFRKAGLWGWIVVNIAVAITLSLLFLKYPEWWILLLIILNAGWQKYMNGRIPAFAGNLPVCKAMKISSELFLCLGLVFCRFIFSDIRHRLCHHYEDSQKRNL